MDDYHTNSYQNAPQIRHLDDTVARPGGSGSSPWSSYGRGGARGDATLEPNTGLTNSYDYALFGLALHELLDRLRLSIVISAVLLLLVIFFTWWTRLVRPVGLLVSLLLALLDVVLLVVEVSGLFRTTSSSSSTTTTSQQQQQQRNNWYYHGVSASAADADASYPQPPPGIGSSKKLTELIDQTEQIGLVILFHPVGKACYLILLGVLCWWIGGGWEVLVGLSFFLEALVLSYCWIAYPEFRRTCENNTNNHHQDNNNNGIDNNADATAHRNLPVHTTPTRWSHFYNGAASPSTPSSSSSAAATAGGGGEGASLLLLQQAARHAFGM